jgi:hypothetical protein
LFAEVYPERSRRDGDGKRVKSVLETNFATTTTYFVGNYYEVTKLCETETITKYYFAGTQRIATLVPGAHLSRAQVPWSAGVRTNGTLNYLLGDHLGSTSLVTDANGGNVIEIRYAARGGVRYASGETPMNYQFTGQRSYEAEFRLYFYHAWVCSTLVLYRSNRAQILR